MIISEVAPKRFLEWQKKLKISLEAKGISQAHVYKGIGMSRNTWERRTRAFNFTADEALRICRLLNGK